MSSSELCTYKEKQIGQSVGQLLVDDNSEDSLVLVLRPHGFSHNISNMNSSAESKMSESGETATKTFAVDHSRVRLDPEAIIIDGEYRVRWLPRVAVTLSDGKSYEGHDNNLSVFFTMVADDNLDLIGKDERDSFLSEWQNPTRTKASLEARTRALRRRFMSFLKANESELLHKAISKAATGHFKSSYKVQGYRTKDNVDVTDDPDWIDVGNRTEFHFRIDVPTSVTLGS